MDLILNTILGYLVGLAANLRISDVVARREAALTELLRKEDALRKALVSKRPIREEIASACADLIKNRVHLGVTQEEGPLWQLLEDETFQSDLSEWFMAGGILEGIAVKKRLLSRIEDALTVGGASAEQVTFLKNGYFEELEKVIFSNPILSNWRHQLSLDYLREQVSHLRQLAENAAGNFSPERQKAALTLYCEKALSTWDIIDLSNLPEGDIHIATQKLLLRQLFMPLRITVEQSDRGDSEEVTMARLEAHREARRHREAGHRVGIPAIPPTSPLFHYPVGERLRSSQRLVILGDPGGGKTTLLRWLATAYLLRFKGDVAFSQIPDTDTLPDALWIPVLIRCRDLGEADLCRSFTDFLEQHFNKSELLPADAEVILATILDRFAKGEALLLVDGLDEITSPRVRMLFCQELERTSVRYPDVPIIVTSRIVGYRDMPYRMGASFEHGQIAELNRDDKDRFAQRWVDLTEQHLTATERKKRAGELLRALHSSDRIERLTGNPLLLTTLALVKRKVGKLPNRRTKLYAEAVSVLLNWNPSLYQTIEEDEALPQLEYLAYEMCRRGVQRLTDEEMLSLLDRLRAEYPHIRAIRRRDPHSFLELIEARSSILIKSGGIWHDSKSPGLPVWEFRHLTFQEYLAARALHDGRYPDRPKSKSLAEQVAPLAGAVERVKRPFAVHAGGEEIDLPESWREVLRLLVADCRDDDVDQVVLAILKPLAEEDANSTKRPRAVLAALCLADEPNVSELTAAEVLAEFAARVSDGDGSGTARTSLDRAALELGGSIWVTILMRCLIQEFLRRPDQFRAEPGGLWGMVEVAGWGRTNALPTDGFEGLPDRLQSSDRLEVVSATLAVMESAFEGKAKFIPVLIERLLLLVSNYGPEGQAAAWALVWMSGGWIPAQMKAIWLPSGSELETLAEALTGTTDSDPSMRRYIIYILGKVSSEIGSKAILPRLQDVDPDVRIAAIDALGKQGDTEILPHLLERLSDSVASVRLAAVRSLYNLKDKRAVSALLKLPRDPDVEIQVAVIEVMGELGERQAVPHLLTLLVDPEASIRTAAIRTLGKLADSTAVSLLLTRLGDAEASVRAAAIEVLGELGKGLTISPLLERLDDPDPNVRSATIAVLGRIGDKRAVVPLLAILEGSEAKIRRAAIVALGELGDQAAAIPLTQLLEDQNYRLRVAAAEALVRLESERGPFAFRELLSNPSAQVRRAALKALVNLHNTEIELTLLSRDFDGLDPWWDPGEPITATRLAQASLQLNKPISEVRTLYASIAQEYCLKV